MGCKDGEMDASTSYGLVDVLSPLGFLGLSYKNPTPTGLYSHVKEHGEDMVKGESVEVTGKEVLEHYTAS